MELTLPSGKQVEVNLSTTTLRMVFNNPFMKAARGFMHDEDALPGDRKEEDLFELLEPTMEFLEMLDKLVARCVLRPKLWVPADLDDVMPAEGYDESIETMETHDKLFIFGQAIGHMKGIGEMVPLGSS